MTHHTKLALVALQNRDNKANVFKYIYIKIIFITDYKQKIKYLSDSILRFLKVILKNFLVKNLLFLFINSNAYGINLVLFILFLFRVGFVIHNKQM